MNRLSIVFLYLVCVSFCLLAEEPLTLSFQQLNEFDQDAVNNKLVTIRGFLYPGKEGQWILASEPNLKSCCIGSQGKIRQQLVVTGDITKTAYDNVVEVQGVFSIDPKNDSSGNLVQLYLLKDTKMMEKSTSGFPILSLIAFGIVLGYFLGRKKKF